MAERSRVFFDASVLVAASISPSGGSSAAIDACTGFRFCAAISALVLDEVRTNLVRKFGDSELLRFYELLATASPEVVPNPSAQNIDLCEPLTGAKDAHVLAAALDCEAEFLLTLDRRHLLNDRVLGAGLPIEVVTPGDFLERIVRGSSEAP